MLVASDCTAELMSHLSLQQNVGFEMKHQRVDQPLAVSISKRGDTLTESLKRRRFNKEDELYTSEEEG